MASEKDFRVRKGLVVANTVLVTNGQNVGIGNTSPLERFRVEGATSVSGNLSIAGVSTINATGVYHPVGTLSAANVNVGSVYTVNVYSTSTINAASFTVSNFVANTTGVYHSGIVNSSTLAVGNTASGLIVNSTGAYHTGIVNAATINTATYTLGSRLTIDTTGIVHSGNITSSNTLYVGNTANALIVNSTGAYHTGVINASSHTIGSSLIANATGVYHTGIVNSAILAVGNTANGLSVNSTGAYHTGVINASSHTVGLSLIANSTGMYHTGIVNAASVNTALYTLGSRLTIDTTGITHSGNITSSNTVYIGNTGSGLTVNSTGAYHTGIVNASVINSTTFSVGSNISLTSSGLSLISSTNSAVNTIVNSSSVFTPYLNVNGNIVVNGNFTISGNLVSSGTSQANGDFTPTITGSYSIGNTSTRWLNIYAANSDLTTYASVGNSSYNTAITSTTVNVSIANTANILQVFSTAILQCNTTTGFLKISNATVNTTIAVPTSSQWSSANIFLRANGSWGDVSAVVGGSNTQIQFNDSGSVNGTSGLTFDKSTNNLNVTNNILSGGSVNATSFTATNLTANSTTVAIGTATVNSSAYVLLASGNSTVNSYANIFTNSISLTTSSNVGNVATYTNVLSGSITLTSNVANSNAVNINTTAIVFGNTTVNSTINSTSFTGTANNANNLGGIAAINYQANTGLVSNSTGTHVNSTYIATLTANNANNLGGIAAANYTANIGLVSNSTGTHVNANTGIVANSSGTFVNSSYIGTLSASNALNLGGVDAAFYVQNTDSRTLSGNLTLSGSVLTLSPTTALNANGSNGISGQVLSSNGSAIYWSTAAQSQRIYQRFSATAGQTDFSVTGGFTNGSIDVYYNGVHLSADDWTVTTANVVTLTPGANAGAIVEVSGWSSLSGAVTSVDTTLKYLWTANQSFTSNLNVGNTVTGNIIISNTSLVFNSNSITNATINTTVYTGTANNTNFLGGTSATTYRANTGLVANATGTHVLANTGIIANSSGLFVNSSYIGTLGASNALTLGGVPSANYVQFSDSRTLSGNIYFSGANNFFASGLTSGGSTTNVVVGTSSLIFNANSTTNATINATSYTGTASDSSKLGGVSYTNYAAGQGLIANSTGTHVNPGTGIIANATGTYVNATYIGTLTVDSANKLGGVAAVNYTANTGLVSNSTGTHVNSTYIATLTANNATNLGGVGAASYVQNTDSRTLSGNLYFTAANNVFNSLVAVGNVLLTHTDVTPGTITFNSNSTVNSTINTTFYSGTSNNSNYFGGYTVGNFLTNTGSFSLSGNITFSANLISSGRLSLLGSVQANSSTGGAGQALLANGNGGVYWGSAPATAGGSDGYVQFNDGGSTVNGYANFTYNKTTLTASLTNAISVPLITSPSSITIDKSTTLSANVTFNSNATMNNGVLNLTNTAIALQGSLGTDGQVLTSNAGGSPTWAPFPASGFLTGTVTINANNVPSKGTASFTNSNITGLTTSYKIIAMLQSPASPGTKLVSANASGVSTATFTFMNDNSSGSTTDAGLVISYIAWI